MKSKITITILLLAFLGLSFSKVYAQYVNIPDANLVTWLTTNYPTCMNGNQMDTTCSSILSATNIDITNIGCANINGIEYFDNLITLYCGDSQLSSIVNLPNTLQYLYCWNSAVTQLPTLPNGLKTLSCIYGPITNLPTLPSSLLVLEVTGNTIVNLPTLPQGLSILKCANNALTSLPTLPSSLTQLNCQSNSLQSLPLLPNNLSFLNCSFNSITCYPIFPSSLSNQNQCNISNNPATCLPNYVPAMNASALALPLCASGNANGCPVAASTTCTSCVTIPDPNFVTWLTTNYPTCMTGNQMDTTCSSIINEDTVIVSGLGIHDLTGIQYFDNLVTLKCYNDSLTSLPSLPSGLNYLDCANNQLTNLPGLPGMLSILYCAYNQLSSLPNLSLSLISLGCNNNQIVNLPTLSSNLQFLGCNNNQIVNLPALPSGLIQLFCDNNLLTALPTLPTTLIYLDCQSNQLTTLPNLPNQLSYLSCSNNQISTIPTLPNTLNNLDIQNNLISNLPVLPSSLITFACSYNQISSLPILPSSLLVLACGANPIINLPILPNSITYLLCSGCQITSLPSLPNSLSKFLCSNTNITCLPQLPATLIDSNYFDISNNPLTCLPNYVPAMHSNDLAMPLCAAGNTNGCPVTKGIVGKVYKDANSNCSMDAGDNSTHNIPVKFYNPITNVFGAAYTAANGVYNYVCNTGTNLVLVDTLNKPYKANCPHPGIDSTVVTTTANSLAQNVNFDIACKNGFDVGVQSITHNGLVFPGQTHTLQVLGGDVSQWYGLNCNAGTSGQMQITINGPVTFAGVPSGALTPSISGNVYTYTISDFGAINSQTAFKLLLTTNTTAQSGNTVCVNVNITTIASDNNTLNNNSYLCYNVVNSYDPNYKEVYPTDVLPGYSDWFTYTVHFQNLGTAAAININVLDTLDSNLDEETFEVINYSHYNETVLQNHVINFKFPNIQLPDSTSNPIGSNGFVQYRIKPKANIPLGTQVKNTAHIYFDYNPAVVTNTTINNFTTLTSLSELPQSSRLWLYPNPAKDKLIAESSKFLVLSSKLSIIDVLGNEVMSQIITNQKTELNIQNLPKGIYFVKCGNETLKFIKQ